jgi:hypothetical protein
MLNDWREVCRVSKITGACAVDYSQDNAHLQNELHEGVDIARR